MAVSFSTTPGYNANVTVITREPSPTELKYQNGLATYTLTVTLGNGSIVTHSGYLVHNTATDSSLLSYTPGHRVYTFVPSDLTSLQSFMDQYRASAVSADIDTTVALADISDGSDPSAVVDVQGEDSGATDYIGSITADLPHWREGGGPQQF